MRFNDDVQQSWENASVVFAGTAAFSVSGTSRLLDFRVSGTIAVSGFT